ncbi:MAG TPA: pyridoxal phosphate-dependent aminotransferase [Bacteroidales bacterium]|nr:pyridoxal phosphate-dependent aminotransferase [Bacteroidales bacterium]
MNPTIDKMSPFIVMEVLEKAQEMEKRGINIIHMEVGEPDFSVPVCVSEASIKAVAEGYTHYTHSLGMPELRDELARFYKKEYNVTVDPECIILTSGSSPAILTLLMLLCNTGDEVLVSNPGYACYRNFALACHAIPVDVPLSAHNGFQFDINEVLKAKTDKTRAMFINSPMNPCGVLIKDEVFEGLVKTGIPIISDEIYHGLVYEGKTRSILEFTNEAFVVSGFSKRFAMTGLRLGYLIAPKKYIRSLQILQQNLFICAPSVSQYAAIAALKSAEEDVNSMRQVYNERRVYMISRLRAMGFIIETEPQGAFYIFADAGKFTNNAYQFAFEVLENAHVGITPGTDFGSRGEGFVRFSYANSLENLKEGLDRLERYLKN